MEIKDPILQVLGYKAIPDSDPTRYRLHISDEQFSTSNKILATNLNHLISDNHMEKYSIVQVSKLVCNRVNTQPSKLVIILLEMEVLTPGEKIGGRFGNPKQLKFDEFYPAPESSCPHCNQHNHQK